jgi:hypothetical protein
MKRIVALALACGALVACAGIPTSGPVREGDSEVAQQQPFAPLLQGPTPDASPRAIVQGFLAASSGGSVSGFDVAREFLTDEAAMTWNPLAHVTIFDSRQVEQLYDDATGTHTYRVPVAAVVDADGVMIEASSDVQADVSFTVTRDEFGQNRISTLADGIVMSAADFGRFFRPLKLYFASADAQIAIPEVRWFANNDQVATAVARELVAGPSPWLADAVVTGFPPGAALDIDAVVVDEGTALVSLATGSSGTSDQRALAQAQLDLTLRQLISVQSVTVTVGGVPLAGDQTATLGHADLPPDTAAVIAGDRLGLFDGSDVLVTSIEAGLLPPRAWGLALAYDSTTTAFVVDGDVAVSTVLAQTPALELYDPSAPVPADAPLLEFETVLDGDDLIAPSFDRHGWVWSTERTSGGSIVAALPGGDQLTFDAPWLAGRSVQAIAVSRDGTRLAVLSRATGTVQSLDVAAITREPSGAPLSIGQPLAMVPSLEPALDLTWSDATGLVTLFEDSGNLEESEVGGWTRMEAVLPEARRITARNGVRTLLAIDAEGSLVARAGNSWTVQVIGVSDVAYAG